MSVLLTSLSFDVSQLNRGENEVLMSYFGASTTNDIELVLKIQNETRVYFKDDNGVNTDTIPIPNQLTAQPDSHDQQITVHVSGNASPRTAVFLVLTIKGTTEQVTGSMYF